MLQWHKNKFTSRWHQSVNVYTWQTLARINVTSVSKLYSKARTSLNQYGFSLLIITVGQALAHIKTISVFFYNGTTILFCQRCNWFVKRCKSVVTLQQQLISTIKVHLYSDTTCVPRCNSWAHAVWFVWPHDATVATIPHQLHEENVQISRCRCQNVWHFHLSVVMTLTLASEGLHSSLSRNFCAQTTREHWFYS